MSDAPPVLIGFAEALAAPEAAWSLLENGFENVTVFTRRGAAPALRRCAQVTIREITAPEDDYAAAAAELEALACESASVVLPLDDLSLKLCQELPATITSAGASGAPAALALDKRLQMEAARAAGFHVPETTIIETRDAALALDRFPLILKPALAARVEAGKLVRGGGSVCQDRTELERAVESWGEREPLLVQPFLVGRGEGVFGLATPAGVRAWSGHRRVRMMNPAGSGSSACESHAVEDAVKAASEKLLAAIGWRGLFMVELLCGRDGIPWFVELNGRAWGSMALARRQGFEYPAWTVQQALDPDFTPPEPPPGPPLLCRNLGREILHLLFVFKGRPSDALVEWPGRLETIGRLLRWSSRHRWYNYRRGDARVFWSDARATVSKVIRRRKQA